MSRSQLMCDRCRERKNVDKITAGAFGYRTLCKSCKYLLEPKETLSDY